MEGGRLLRTKFIPTRLRLTRGDLDWVRVGMKINRCSLLVGEIHRLTSPSYVEIVSDVQVSYPLWQSHQTFNPLSGPLCLLVHSLQTAHYLARDMLCLCLKPRAASFIHYPLGLTLG